MNVLNREKQEMVLNMLVEGNSIRGIERITGVHRDTIVRLLRRVGEACQADMDAKFNGLDCTNIECDEIWTFVGKKQARIRGAESGREKGDQYVFVALDRDTKLVPVFMVGKRNRHTTLRFLSELRIRVPRRFQLSTDQYIPYRDAVDQVFGINIDYAQITKRYHRDAPHKREGYAPPRLQKTEKFVLTGKPDKKKICTSYVERQNLTMRTQLRRFTRLTNAFSKTLESLKAAVALHFWHYNFMRYHNSLRQTPAMAAGITTTFSNWEAVLN